MTKSFTAKVAEPIDLRVLGADTQSDLATTSRVAMIVCHGMGQQVPFETLDAVATAIADEHTNGGGTVEVVLRFVRPIGSEKMYPRAEVTLKQAGQDDKIVHLYEAYWAPLTEGEISYAQTVWHLLGAGLNGLKESYKRVFRRWMFGGEKDLPIDYDTTHLLKILLIILTPLFLLPMVIALPLFLGKNVEILKGLIAVHGYLAGVIYLSAVTAIAVPSYLFSKFVVQYMGDVIIYVSSNEVNRFWKIRDEIKQIGLSLAKIVYGAIDTTSNSKGRPHHFLYSGIVVVGHSLGSVVAYDTLNAIINQDQLDGNERKVVSRTEAFITLGSPLDKIAFLFRQKAKDAFTRDMLAAAYQPMILDYKNRPQWWINVFCKKDIVSGSLEYYDDPACANSEQRRVRNFVDPYNKLNLVLAHTGYWDRPLARTFLYLAAIGEMRVTENDSFRHSSNKVGIRSFGK